MKDKFKKLGGGYIEDVAAYVKEYLIKYPETSIFVGTDSQARSRRGKTTYATVIAMYDEIRKDGVHYIFKRVTEPTLKRGSKSEDVLARMWIELERSMEVAEYLEYELEGFLRRRSIEEVMVMPNGLGGTFKGNQTKLVTIDADINPFDGNGHNLSNASFEAAKGYLGGMGYRCRFKPNAWAASVSADLICNR